MTKQSSALLVLILVLGFSIVVSAQNFGRKGATILRAGLKAGLDETGKKARIHWQFNANDWGDIFMHFDEDRKVYYARRASQNGIEAFAKTKEYVEQLKADGNKVSIIGEIDWEKPYVVRLMAEKEYSIEGYYETVELENLFVTLDKILNRRVIPIFQGRQPQELGDSEFRITAHIGFPSRKFWRWKYVPKELESLKLA